MQDLKLNLSELKLTSEQEKWVKEWLYKWGAWINTGRLDKRQVNIIGRLMDSVTPSEPQRPICTDEEGLMISQMIDEFFTTQDKELHFIVYGYYVENMSVNRLSVLLFDEIEPRVMKPCVHKPSIRKPSLKTVKRYVKCRLDLATAIIHELLLKGFIILKNAAKNHKNIKICY
ncbi:antiterminator Q family protein [Avibacterium paragallinarum]|uniref:Antitermination protein n=1 Tax=Avibacterium paragallinarum TaxID=728 RepID=H6U8Q3_AVIPA|nr:antiterminator Q family protein [Avibacterium paragallinarum]AFA45151.1 phage anti-termination protein Q [Avibacterium paragallinarum]KAA6208032.1 antitermination protein [Avibacterium paragallinarum]KKB00398.1 antitermination protein [Avibacterium paragallinarum]RZN51780.1 antitermination protein [Avibacterium paragallinarum]RZN54115.1 antitermination protein [Avibacterium paragallinarum]